MTASLVLDETRAFAVSSLSQVDVGQNRQPITQITTGLDNRSNPFRPTGLGGKDRHF